MGARLRPMRDDEYDAFYAAAVEEYARDLEENAGFTREHARAKSVRDHETVLTRGFETPDSFLRVVEGDDGRRVGIVWWAFQTSPIGGRRGYRLRDLDRRGLSRARTRPRGDARTRGRGALARARPARAQRVRRQRRRSRAVPLARLYGVGRLHGEGPPRGLGRGPLERRFGGRGLREELDAVRDDLDRCAALALLLPRAATQAARRRRRLRPFARYSAQASACLSHADDPDEVGAAVRAGPVDREPEGGDLRDRRRAPRSSTSVARLPISVTTFMCSILRCRWRTT